MDPREKKVWGLFLRVGRGQRGLTRLTLPLSLSANSAFVVFLFSPSPFQSFSLVSWNSSVPKGN